MKARVLVTGISGFIGSHVALALLYAGYGVRGSLRDMRRAGEVAEMLERAGGDLSRLEFVPLDLEDDHGWREAMDGVRFVQHVASPNATREPDDPNDMIGPAVDGTRRAIAAALDADIERIVVTSSVAAIAYGHADPSGPFTDADWTEIGGDDVTPYTESKTRAELEAWTLMEAVGRRADLVTINPSVVLGPLLGRDVGASAQVVQRLIGAPVVPNVGFNVVDVRDVANLHVAAMTSPSAGGHRYIAAAAPATAVEIAEALRSAFPDLADRFPRLVVHDWLVRLAGRLSPEVRSILPNLGVIRRYDAKPAEALLGRPFITPRVAAAATLQSLLDLGLVRGAAPQKKG